jgi:beta-galactosidase/beta-glucuronidase
MPGEIEITVGDVNDVEAHLYARYVAPADVELFPTERTAIRGTLRGPHCESARTLPAVFMFRGVPGESRPTAEAIVNDPCTWSAELPHLYQCDVVAEQGGRVVAEYHGAIGFRRSS